MCDDIIKKYRLDKEKWTYKGTHAVLHYYFPVAEEPIKPLKKYFGDGYHICLFFIKNNFANWQWNEADMERLRSKFIDKVYKNPRYINDYRREWEKRLRSFQSIFKQITAKKLSQLSNSVLLKLYERFYKSYLDEYGIAIGIQDAFSMHADRFMEPAFRQIFQERQCGDKFNEYYVMLMSPVQPSFINKEEESLLTILKKKRQGLEVTTDLKKHAKKYYFISNNYARVQALDWQFFNNKLGELEKNSTEPNKKLAQLKQSFQDVKQKKRKIISELNLPREFRLLIKITESFAEVQDTRKMYVLIANHYQRLFIDEIGKRGGYTYEEMQYTVFYEMKKAIEGKIDRNILRKRKSACLCIFTPHGYEIVAGKEAEDIFVKVFSHISISADVEQISGTVASRGLARGRVKIILKAHDLVNFNQGEILFSTMTRPEMTVAIKKAAAIVTDEGGITSHAAIVSRELGIPCIIGTKIATKVFKDGDLVEVNANDGTVRKIK